jgi:two-component system phosphate regulon response regulator PhoB
MNDTCRILIVEDHKPLRDLLSFLLTNAGYKTVDSADAESALVETARQHPDLILLDWQLPDMDGIDLLRRWRTDAITAQVPVIMVTGRTSESERVAGLQAGADDYISKPFGRDELLARIQAVLRRTHERPETELEVRRFAGLTLDIRSLQVTAAEKPVHLGPIEFKMLNLFMTRPERVLSRTQIINQVWRVNAHADERTVDVHVRRLRLALQHTGYDACIQTVRGVGYRLSDKSATASQA